MRTTRVGAALGLSALLLCAAYGASSLISPWKSVRPDGESTPPSGPSDQVDGDLAFAAPNVDLGSIREPVQHEFIYRNRGTETVTLGEVKSSCGCVAVKPDQPAVRAGESGRIVVTVDPRRQLVGRHAQTVDVEYRGTDEKRKIRLTLQYHNQPDLVGPEKVAIQAAAGQTGSVRFDLIDYRERPFALTAVSCTNELFQVRITKRPEAYLPGWRFELEVTTAADATIGTHTGVVRIGTDDPQHVLISVVVEATVANRLRVSPTSLQLSKSVDGVRSGRLFLSDSLGESVEIDSVSTSDSRLTSAVERVAGAKSAIIAVQFHDKNSASIPETLSVRINLRTPRREELCVEVRP